MMTRLVSKLFFFCVALLCIAFVAPSFIDWNKHKEFIISKVSPYLEHEIKVEGNVSFHLVPEPEIILQTVSLKNKGGGLEGDFLSLKELTLRVNFLSLLEGRVEIETFQMLEPIIHLEVDKKGEKNWRFIFKKDPFPKARIGLAPKAVKINEFFVKDGSVHYKNKKNGQKFKLEHLNFSVSANSLLGPYQLIGDVKYKGYPVDLKIVTEKYNEISSVPVHVSFLPRKKMPAIKFNGVLDLDKGFAMQGELSLNGGTLASLLDEGPLTRLSFMQETADLRGLFQVKENKVLLSDMKAKLGKKGILSGHASMEYHPSKDPFFSFDGKGENLIFTRKINETFSVYPRNLSGHILFKGKKITWGGYKFKAADLNADFTRNNWMVKSVDLSFSNNTDVKLKNMHVDLRKELLKGKAYLTTSDFSRFVGRLLLKNNNAFKLLEEKDFIKKVSLSTDFKVFKKDITLSKIDATFGEEAKMAGLLSISRHSNNPNFKTDLILKKWNLDLFPKEAYNNFLEKTLKINSNIKLLFYDVMHRSLLFPEITVNGKTDQTGFHIEKMNGKIFDGKDEFSLLGSVPSFQPKAKLDLTYTLKSKNMQKIKRALNLSLPPLPNKWKVVDIKGHLKGDDNKYNFLVKGSIDGSNVSLKGLEKVLNLNETFYSMDIKVKNKKIDNLLSALNFPYIAPLIFKKGVSSLSGEFLGKKNAYKINKLLLTSGKQNVEGGLERIDSNHVTGNLSADQLDLDKWLKETWKIKENLSLNLKAKNMVFQRKSISNPRFMLQATPSSLKLHDLEGEFLGGDLNGDLTFEHEKDKKWSSHFKGKLKDINLNRFRKHFGFTTGVPEELGTLSLDLSSVNNDLDTAKGIIHLKAPKIRIKDFSFFLMEDILGLKELPKDLQAQVDKSFRNSGSTGFKNVDGSFKLSNQKLDILSLKLLNPFGDLDVKGTASFKTGMYDLSAKLFLKRPKGVSAIDIRRLPDSVDYIVDVNSIKKYITENSPVILQPEVSAVPTAAKALKPIDKEEGFVQEEHSVEPPTKKIEGGAINDVLDRLGETE